MVDPKNRRDISQEEMDYNDDIDYEFDMWGEQMNHVYLLGHIPSVYSEEWDVEMEAQYLGEATTIKTEGSTESSPEEWRDFLRKLEEDLK